MKKLVREISTGDDNLTYDFVPVFGMIAALVGLSLEVYTVVWKGAAFDFQQFGIGLGALFAALGAAIKLKDGK